MISIAIDFSMLGIIAKDLSSLVLYSVMHLLQRNAHSTIDTKKTPKSHLGFVMPSVKLKGQVKLV